MTAAIVEVTVVEIKYCIVESITGGDMAKVSY